MSRDYTPKENYITSLRMAQDFDKYLSTVDGWAIRFKGEEKSLYTKAQKEKHKLFPYLARTSVVVIDQVDMETCQYVEKCLKVLIEDNCILDKIVEKWFEGQLDEDFYYHEANNKLFVKYLLRKFQQKKEH